MVLTSNEIFNDKKITKLDFRTYKPILDNCNMRILSMDKVLIILIKKIHAAAGNDELESQEFFYS